MASVELIISGGVGEVRLNRPAVLNAIDEDMDRALAEAWKQIGSDKDIRVALLTGSGERAFCAGADLKSPPAGANGLSFGGGLTGIGGRLMRLKKPLIAAVHGHVLGLGFELALCADIIIAADDTRFRLPEAHAGFIDHCGVVHRAVRQLPHHIAMAMIVASEPLGAQRAFQLGLVNEITPSTNLAATAKSWTEKLLACSPLASQAAKQAALAGLECGLEAALGQRYPLIDKYSQSADSSEASLAWQEGRKPQWRGE
ncbi:MAG: enoyl-CoA hydratase-related protein [Parasphingorhabdus sp.]